MCIVPDPATMIKMGGEAAGGVLQAVGSIQGGKAAEREYDYQAGLARNNALVAAAGARDAQERGDIEEARYARDVGQFQGQQRAAIASSGIVGGEGSALRVVQDVGAQAYLDAETIRRNTEREVLGFRNERNRFVHQAQMLKHQGDAAKRAGKINAALGLMGTAADVGLSGYESARPKRPKPQDVRINPAAVAYFYPRPAGVY